ncbi:MAG: hypothetical protein HRU07_05735 [Nitrosopumilus sp.]|nr:hypothetical protein [Nitrosopumilus sp.]NRA05647.1 hypothetical protein [Nitrosopumilus sp.]
MKILQVPILFCFRCKKSFTPRIDNAEECVIIPKACPNHKCRSQTWNIPDSELEIIKLKQRQNLLLGPGCRTGMRKSVPVLDKYKPKKKEKKPLIICQECEIFYHDEESLKRHQHRRHHGMCNNCHSSNVYVMKRDGMNICKTCFESKNN